MQEMQDQLSLLSEYWINKEKTEIMIWNLTEDAEKQVFYWCKIKYLGFVLTKINKDLFNYY